VSAAFKSAKYRDHLERLLKEVQTQSEELQAQQEELRVTNEELEEQHAELEQTNSQLEQQTRALEMQKDLLDQRNDALTDAQESLVEKASELEKSSRYKSEFLANMSHELRTPLNSSLILAKLLADNKEDNLTKQQIEFARQISASGNDLLTLINDILDLSKVESGKLDITPEEIKIPKFLAHLEQTFIPVAREKIFG
jgi:signal transduction histidine kinase